MSIAKWTELVRRTPKLKLIAGVAGVVILVGAVAFTTLLGWGAQGDPHLTDAASTPNPAAFDAEAMIGQPLSALTAMVGEPTEQLGELRYRWSSGADYDFSAVLSSDGETIRELYISRGPSLLSLGAGDSAQAAQTALLAADGQGRLNTVDSGDGQVSYAAPNADASHYYQFDCTDDAIVYYCVRGYDIPL